jgi:GNAT superfamily N-acetyltransferase
MRVAFRLVPSGPSAPFSSYEPAMTSGSPDDLSSEVPTLEVVRTYLELTAPDALRAADFPDATAVRIAPRTPCTVPEYRALYDAVGRAHRWQDRLAWSDEQLAEWLARPDVGVRVLERRDAVDPERWVPAGYYELARHPDGGVELVYFGLVPDAQGAGLGRALLTHAVRDAWGMGARRVWLHTCTLDGPTALPNYRARGFHVTGEERYTVPTEP